MPALLTPFAQACCCIIPLQFLLLAMAFGATRARMRSNDENVTSA